MNEELFEFSESLKKTVRYDYHAFKKDEIRKMEKRNIIAFYRGDEVKLVGCGAETLEQYAYIGKEGESKKFFLIPDKKNNIQLWERRDLVKERLDEHDYVWIEVTSVKENDYLKWEFASNMDFEKFNHEGFFPGYGILLNKEDIIDMTLRVTTDERYDILFNILEKNKIKRLQIPKSNNKYVLLTNFDYYANTKTGKEIFAEKYGVEIDKVKHLLIHKWNSEMYAELFDTLADMNEFNQLNGIAKHIIDFAESMSENDKKRLMIDLIIKYFKPEED